MTERIKLKTQPEKKPVKFTGVREAKEGDRKVEKMKTHEDSPEAKYGKENDLDPESYEEYKTGKRVRRIGEDFDKGVRPKVTEEPATKPAFKQPEKPRMAMNKIRKAIEEVNMATDSIYKAIEEVEKARKTPSIVPPYKTAHGGRGVPPFRTDEREAVGRTQRTYREFNRENLPKRNARGSEALGNLHN